MAARGRRSGRERWANAESALTKALLLGVFVLGLVAQFVQPVGDALEGKAYLGGSIVSLVGYVLYTEVRELNRRTPPEAGSEIRTADLGEHIERVVGNRRARRVRIDAVGYTGETVKAPVMRSLEALEEGARRSVRVRILVPDFTVPMAIPGTLDAQGRAVDDPAYRAYQLDRVRWNVREFAGVARSLRGARRADMDVQFRMLRITPLLKFCLLNGDELFDGIYDKVVQESAPVPPERQILDLKGYQAVLTHWRAGSGAAGREKVAQRQDLFDTLWRLSSPLPDAGSG
ncbi:MULTISPECIES: hypothetical protein [Streptomyces]|uniref:Uncharacterized protein n=1 Tax=Streptomyces venezuelae TaxID=54571 RepID=A0A5P2BBX6_STRVZ|nr:MULTISPECIES: hypothetical protein [Streptomyces]NEA04274.1 hypothetical protein [Streptomyces sp. SID10116]MYY83347.1 hypothetical protein [Streptomyces sp. SID335]MYZ13160.1 hypothetical protein [Streptomyces sp. SID337]NDZ86025.1 hypothetical protein [Streptomyces sp. SID10115]NEB42992.1 hypothetical protein [Streptomyces sp. SID339]